MKIKRVKIGNCTYKIIRKKVVKSYATDGKKYRGYSGMYFFKDGRIELDSRLKSSICTYVLVHEICHGILHQGGFTDESEALVDVMANGLLALIRDNKDLVKLVQRKLK